jgi:KDO2-lipid IV(A) lauroyltransferase
MTKRRAPLAQDFIWRLEALLFDLVSACARLLPIEWVSGFGGWLLRKLGPLTRAHKIADRNLRLAFPELSLAERDTLLLAQWDNLGR